MPSISFAKVSLPERSDLPFFYAFLWTIPFTWRKIIYQASESQGSFNEYLSASFSISEALLMVAILIYVLQNINIILSNSKVSEGIGHLYIFLLLWLALSLLWSENVVLGAFSLLRFLEVGLLAWYVTNVLITERSGEESSTWNIFRTIIVIFITSSVFQTALGVLQVWKGSSLGLGFLGESFLSIGGPGVAKLYVLNDLLLRAYGTFLHPNILAFYLVASFFLLLYGRRRGMFHVEHWVVWVIYSIIGIGLLLTFSKAALGSAIAGLLYLNYEDWKASVTGMNVPRGTNRSILSMFHVEHWMLLIFLTIFVGVLFFQDSHFLKQSYTERVNLLPATLELIEKHPLNGIGIGNYVNVIINSSTFMRWQWQPIHNVPLLIWTEIGIIGLGIFLLLARALWRSVPRGTMFFGLKSLLIFAICVSLADHYVWDMLAPQLVLGVIIGLIYAEKSYLTNINKIVK